MTRFPDPAAIRNLRTALEFRDIDGAILPFTVNGGELPTCYLCCPTVAYIEYAREELRNFKNNAFVQNLLGFLVTAAAPLVRATRFDRQVQPNNWLLATNIWCELGRDALGQLTEKLIADYPGHAIVWRSLNEISDVETLRDFLDIGYHAYPARQVYLYDCRRGIRSPGRDLARDLRLLGDGRFDVVEHEELSERDDAAIARLYAQLYLEKYTALNPQYLPEFIRASRIGRSITYLGLRDRDGILAGVVGLFQKGDVITAPIVGYDTGRPQSDGLYRRLMALTLQKARDEGLLYNMSAGAAGFKRARGGVPAIEYNMIYNRHLPVISRAAAFAMRTILENVGVPVMRRQEL